MTAGRVLAIDLGQKRIGLAVSDELGITAQALPTYLRTELAKDLEHIAALVKEKAVVTVLLGLPLMLDGSEGMAVSHVRAFEEALRPLLPEGVVLAELDERMTTARAGKELRPLGRHSTLRRAGELDRAAAQILLTAWLGRPTG